MTSLRTAAALAVALAAAPAVAQLSNRSIAVESGISAPLRGPAPAGAALALTATGWLEGELEALARIAVLAGPRTSGRGSDGVGFTGTAGLRLSLLPGPLRPQLSVELGWARVDGPMGPSDRLALAAGAGLEWFPVRDVSIAARAALRSAGGAPLLELVAGAAAYF